MTGMTPAALSFIGRKLRVPPKTLFPFTNLADCVGMRRWALVMAMTPTITATKSSARTTIFSKLMSPVSLPSVKTDCLILPVAGS